MHGFENYLRSGEQSKRAIHAKDIRPKGSGVKRNSITLSNWRSDQLASSDHRHEEESPDWKLGNTAHKRRVGIEARHERRRG